MPEPRRIQLSRKKEWQLPPNTIVVSRPTKWCNPFKIGPRQTRAQAVARFGMALRHQWSRLARSCGWKEAPLGLQIRFDFLRHELPDLQGKNLACSCKLCEKHKHGKPLDVRCPDCEPCHVDLLGEAANG